MKKLKVVTIVGTRPEIIRLSRLIPKLDEYTDHILVHTGQNYDRQLNEVFFEDLELRLPDYFLNVDTTSFGTVMGDTIKKSEELFLKEKPDAVMILGDTNSAIAAVVAERMHIPVYHMEAGNRSFDNNVPEELNRKMVDHVSSFNLPYTDYALRNLLNEGVHPRFVHVTGSPIREVFEHHKSQISKSNIVQKLGLESGEYFLVSLHREENVDTSARLELALESLHEVWNEWKLPIVVSTHPRTKKRLSTMPAKAFPYLQFHQPFGYLDYNKLQIESKCVISDSGSVGEEAAIMGFTAVTLRDSMERPEVLDSAMLGMAPLISPKYTVTAVNFAIQSSTRPHSIPKEYEVLDFSDRVVNLVLATSRISPHWLSRSILEN